MTCCRWAPIFAVLALGAMPAHAGSREDVWRSIFARPAALEPASGPAAQIERQALGFDLFRDPRLSGHGARSCASCHVPALGFSNGLPRGVGLDGAPLRRNVPSLFNLAWARTFYWDGRAPTLEAQARVPILEPNEMGGDFATILGRLRADAALKGRFAKAFPDREAITEESILEAIAAYERTIVSDETRFDRWVAGEDAALDELERKGFDIFVGKGGCVACHGGWRFTDDAFHDIGLKSEDPGRAGLPGGTPGLKQFKTPSLRELRQSAPYMHDGSMANLIDVVQHYSGGLQVRPSLAANIRRDLRLDRSEKDALVAFLLTLSSEGEPVRPLQQPGN
jgi:cytochrome c peroxidase